MQRWESAYVRVHPVLQTRKIIEQKLEYSLQLRALVACKSTNPLSSNCKKSTGTFTCNHVNKVAMIFI
jgi:hypothetical protein